MSKKRERENDYIGEEMELLNFVSKFKKVLKQTDPALNKCEFISGKRINSDDIQVMSRIFKSTSFTIDRTDLNNLSISILTNRDERLKSSIAANEIERSRVKRVNNERFLIDLNIADSPYAENYCYILNKVYENFINVANVTQPLYKDGKASLLFYMQSIFSNNLLDFCDKNPEMKINIYAEKGFRQTCMVEVSYNV
jgi:hypothetical protein